MKLTSIAATGKTGSVTVADSLFGAKINQVLLAQAVRVYQSNKRQGTSKVLNRAKVLLFLLVVVLLMVLLDLRTGARTSREK